MWKKSKKFWHLSIFQVSEPGPNTMLGKRKRQYDDHFQQQQVIGLPIDINELAESDEDEEVAAPPNAVLPNQVLPIADLPSDFAGVPQNGMEYLFTVRYVGAICIPSTQSKLRSVHPIQYRRDARRLPRYKKVINPFFQPWGPEEEAIISGDAEVHPDFPSDEWRDLFLEHFMQCREVCPYPSIYQIMHHASMQVHITISCVLLLSLTLTHLKPEYSSICR